MNGAREQKITLMQKARLIGRGLQIIRKLFPSYLGLSSARAFMDALLPLSALYFSSQIIGELAGARSLRRIVLYAVLTTAGLFLLSAVRSELSHRLSIIGSTFNQKLYFSHGERYMQLDFEHVERSRTKEMLADIEAKLGGNGLGIPRLYYCLPRLMQQFFSLIGSCLLLAGLFGTSGESWEGIAASPWAVVIIVALVMLMIMLTFLLQKRAKLLMTDLFRRNPKTNSFFHYYYQYVQPGHAGKEIRIYHQKSLIAKITAQWIGMSPWHRLFRFRGNQRGITAAANALIGGCVYLIIGLRALAGMFGIGSVVRYVGAVTSLVGGTAELINELAEMNTNLPYLAQLYEYLDLPDVRRKGTLTTEKRSDNDYEIEFHNVSFKYPGTDIYALRNLSLKLRVGERLAVVGQNGSGKTTMIKLLCRLYDPTEGSITLNGFDIGKYDDREYMALFGVVFQDFRLFALPIGQNVAASAETDSNRALACLARAGMEARLREMPGGLDTCLYKEFDENGVMISGGEAQKIALARALYKNAPFIVLDEPTAALDPIAEYEVYTKFNEIVDGKTAIFISHRLSSCRFCHDIAVFHEGRLVQRGSHDALLSDANGKYSELWNAQAQYYVNHECTPSIHGSSSSG